MTTVNERPLADADARERIYTAFDATLFVEAGAGTGKTSSLVRRIQELVLSGESELQQIAAITFTEAAAAELRDRVRIAFEDASEKAEPGMPRHDRALRALEQIDIAAIQTLHGFAYRILALYPLEAGLPPRLEIRDDVRSRIAFGERWNDLLDELLQDDSHGLPILEAMDQGLTLNHLRDLAEELHEQYAALPRSPLPVPLIAIRSAPVIEALEEFIGYRDCCSEPGDGLFERMLAAAPLLQQLRATTERSEEGALLEKVEKLNKVGSIGQKGNWTNLASARAAVKRAQDEAADALVEYRRALLLPLLERLRQWVLEYAEARHAEGVLEFQDLLVLARDLLRNHAEVRHALRSRYQRLLIDEFQDTDPIQLEIAALLATTLEDVTGRDWDELPIEHGRLFFVGDPKQAIYHFRGADIRLYERARQVFGAESVTLVQNFRTVPTVIDWVNGVFEHIISKGAHLLQPPYRPLAPSRDNHHPLPVYLLGCQKADITLDALRRQEADEIVATIQQIKREKWQVVERGNGRARPARYEDITILLPARTTFPWLERVLDQLHVPYRVESRTLLYATQEVRDLTNVLAAIDDPTDEVSLVAALRSPAFACADDELYTWRRAGGRWDYRRAAPAAVDASHPVAAAMAALRHLHETRWSFTLNELVEHVIRERKLFEVGYAFRRPRERWQRLRFVADQARAFAANQQSTLREFVAWLREQAKEDVRVIDTVVPHADDDAVRIMTIHAAKGLEFPIVILAGLNTAPNRQKPKLLWGERSTLEVGLTAGQRFATNGYAGALEEENILSGFEKTRLLYVAATRARDYLLVSLHHLAPKNGQTVHAADLSNACGLLGLGQEFTPEPGVEEPSAALTQDAPPSQTETEWQAEREALIARASTARSRAATTIAEAAVPPDEPATEHQPWRRGRAATNIGRAVHATLQSVDLAAPTNLEQVAQAQAEAEGIPAEADEVGRLARAALAAAPVREALAGRYWREVYVGAEVGGIVVEGFIDLLYDTPEGLVVADYKTDSVRDEADIDAAFARYRLQGAAYVLALRELAEQLGRPVARCVFVFLRGAEPRERILEGDALEAAISEVRAALMKS